MKYQLYKEQQIHCDIQTAWSFFSNPANLSRITPPEMGFSIVSAFSEDTQLYKGMIIDYIVKPILHIPLKWRTRITQVNELESFTDFQVRGPYKYWNHFHEFVPNEIGVLMKDRVDYELPLGILGAMAHRLFVKRKLENIFNFRFKVLDNLFNQVN